MSNIIFRKGGVAISKSGTMFVHGSTGKKTLADPSSQFVKTIPGNDEIQGDIAAWGSDNLLPQAMAKDIENTGVLSAGIDAKARIAIGKGPVPARIVGFNKDGYEELEYINDPEILDWLEENNAFEYSYHSLRDIFGFGSAFTQLLLSHDRSKVWGFKRIDPTECRFQKIDAATRRIHNIYMSGDWSQFSDTANSSAHIAKVPLLDRDFPLRDLESRTTGHSFMLALQYALTGRKYYPNAPWYSAKQWVKIAQGVPEMKEAMFANQMTIKYTVDIHPKFWVAYDPRYENASDELKAEIESEFYDAVEAYLVGGNNAYKSLINKMVVDTTLNKIVPGIVITSIDDKIKDGKLLPDSAAANIEILLPLMINSALFGVDMPSGNAYGGGAGSGSNIREGYLVQVMLVEVERKAISRIFNIAKRLNNWDRNIVLRFPNQILTTLNTGANTQSTA